MARIRPGRVELAREPPVQAAVVGDAQTDAAQSRILVAIGARDRAVSQPEQLVVRAPEAGSRDGRPVRPVVGRPRLVRLARHHLAHHGEEAAVRKPDQVEVGEVPVGRRADQCDRPEIPCRRARSELTPFCQPTSRPSVPIVAQSSRPSARRCGLLAPYGSVQVGNRRISALRSDQVRPPSGDRSRP